MKDINIKGYTIRDIESLAEQQAAEMAEEAQIIKEHQVYFVDFGGYFGYSALVFAEGHHIKYANDYALHHADMTRSELRAFYLNSLNNKLFTVDELKTVRDYNDKTKKESMFNASINASFGLNQAANKFSDAYRNLQQQQIVSLSVSIPLVDWGVRKGKYNVAKNNLLVTETSAKQEELTIEEDVIMTVGDFNIQQALIASAEEAVDLADMAYNETKQRFLIGKADINSLTLSLNRQQEAQRNYITALQNYWLSYFKIRKLTLFDFEMGISLSNEFDYKGGGL